MSGGASTLRLVVLYDGASADRGVVRTAAIVEDSGRKIADTGKIAGDGFAQGITDGTVKAGAGLDMLGAKMDELGVRGSSSMSKFGSSLSGIESKGKGVASTISEIGKAAITGGLAAFALAAYEGVKGAMALQKQMEMIHTQAGATQAEVQHMSKAILGLAGPTATAPLQLAQALYHVESVGKRGADALNILKTAAEGAKIGNADLTDVTNALDATVISGMPGVKNYTQAMGALNATVGAGDMTMQDLANAMSTGIDAVAGKAGVSLQSLGAVLATFGDNNIRGSKAAIYTRQMIMGLVSPSAAAVRALSSIGISSTQLGEELRKPDGVVGALEIIKAKLNATGMDATQQASVIDKSFGGVKSGTGVTVLLGELDRLKAKYAAVGAGAGNFGKDWGATTHTLAFQLDELKSTAGALVDGFGMALIPKLEEVGVWFQRNGNQAKILAEIIAGGLGAAMTVFAYNKIGSVITGLRTMSAQWGTTVDLVVSKLGIQNAAEDESILNTQRLAASNVEVSNETIASLSEQAKYWNTYADTIAVESAQVVADTGRIDLALVEMVQEARAQSQGFISSLELMGVSATQVATAIEASAVASDASLTTIDASAKGTSAAMGTMAGASTAGGATFDASMSGMAASAATDSTAIEGSVSAIGLAAGGALEGVSLLGAGLKLLPSLIMISIIATVTEKLSSLIPGAGQTQSHMPSWFQKAEHIPGLGAVLSTGADLGGGVAHLLGGYNANHYATKPQAAPTTTGQWAGQFLNQLGGARSQGANDPRAKFLQSWARQEGTFHKGNQNNPLDITSSEGQSGTSNYNSFGPGGQYHVKHFASSQSGMQGLDRFLATSDPSILNTLRGSPGGGTIAQLTAELGQSGWSGGNSAAYAASIAKGAGGSYGPTNPLANPLSPYSAANPGAATSMGSLSAAQQQVLNGNLMTKSATGVPKITPAEVALENSIINLTGAFKTAAAGGTSFSQQAATVAGLGRVLTPGNKSAAVGMEAAAKASGNPTLANKGVGLQTEVAAAMSKLATIADTDIKAGMSKIGSLQGAIAGTSAKILRTDITGVHKTEMDLLVSELRAVHTIAATKMANQVTHVEAQAATALAQNIAAQVKTSTADEKELLAKKLDAQTTAASDAAAATVTIAGAQSTKIVNATNTQASIITDKATVANNAITAAAVAQKDAAVLQVDSITAAATAVTDAAKILSDAATALVTSITDQTTAATNAAGAQATQISDKSTTQADIIGERGVYGLNAVSQRAKVAIDVQKQADDARIAADQAHLDQVTSQEHQLTAIAQQQVDMDQQQVDAANALAKQQLDISTQQTDAAIAKAQAQADSTTLLNAGIVAGAQAHSDQAAIIAAQMDARAQAHNDAMSIVAVTLEAVAQNAVTMAQFGTSLQQKIAQAGEVAAQAQGDSVQAAGTALGEKTTAAANTLSSDAANAYNLAQANAARSNATAAATLAGIQAQASAQQSTAQSQYNLTQAQGAATMANANAAQAATQNAANLQIAIATQQLAGAQNAASVSQARLQAIYNVDEAMAAAEFKGTGAVINVYGLAATDAAGIADAVSWVAKTKLAMPA